MAHVGPWGGHLVFFPFFFLFPLLVIVVLIVLGVVFGRRRRRMWEQFGGGMGPWGHHGPWGQPARTAETTLADRFANGDIDEKEYRARLEVLRSQYPTPPVQ
jgi:putative membrane protein